MRKVQCLRYENAQDLSPLLPPQPSIRILYILTLAQVHEEPLILMMTLSILRSMLVAIYVHISVVCTRVNESGVGFVPRPDSTSGAVTRCSPSSSSGARSGSRIDSIETRSGDGGSSRRVHPCLGLLNRGDGVEAFRDGRAGAFGWGWG